MPKSGNRLNNSSGNGPLGKEFHRRSFLKGLSAAAAFPALGAAWPLKTSQPPSLAVLSSPADDEAYWKLVRSAYAVPPDYHFLNTGTKGTQPYYTLDRMQECTRTMAEDPWREWKEYDKYIDAKLPMIAEFVGADADEIALMYNTTDGLNAVIHGLPLKAGDEVLLSDQEHPSGNEPWRLREKRDGIVIKHFPTGTPPASPRELVDAAEKAITPKTKVLSVSHLCYTTSLLMPVKELSGLARSKGVLCLVDGAHPLGMINLDMRELGCDFYSAAGQKWLGGPLGSGLLYVKKEHLEWLDPTIVSGGWDVEHGAGKFMARSSVNTPTWAAFVAAMEFQNTIGREKIEGRVRHLATRLRDGLASIPGVKVYTSNDPALSAGLTTISIPFYRNDYVLAALNERYGLYPRTIGHDLNAVRVSTHIISPESEIDMMIDAVADIVKHGLPTISDAALKRAGDEMAAVERLCA